MPKAKKVSRAREGRRGCRDWRAQKAARRRKGAAGDAQGGAAAQAPATDADARGRSVSRDDADTGAMAGGAPPPGFEPAIAGHGHAMTSARSTAQFFAAAAPFVPRQ